jgi:DNA-binding response OmpR family regulator
MNYQHLSNKNALFLSGQIKKTTFNRLMLQREAEQPSELKLGGQTLIEMKILICEDNQLALRAMSVVLEREGYEPVTVSDGNRAMEMLRETDFNLVIVDIHLPYRSGLELIRFLRTDLKKKTPVLIVSAFSDLQMQRQASEMDVSGYITKPFDPQDLIMKIRSVIKE